MDSRCRAQLIREYGSTLYVGLARAVSPTNTNFRLTFLLTRRKILHQTHGKVASRLFKRTSNDSTMHIQKYKRWSNKTYKKTLKRTARTLLCLLQRALLIIQLPGSPERHAQMGVMLMTNFGCTLGATVVFLLLLLLFVNCVQSFGL